MALINKLHTYIFQLFRVEITQKLLIEYHIEYQASFHAIKFPALT